MDQAFGRFGHRPGQRDNDSVRASNTLSHYDITHVRKYDLMAEESRRRTLTLGARTLRISYPSALRAAVAALFGALEGAQGASGRPPDITLDVSQTGDDAYTIIDSSAASSDEYRGDEIASQVSAKIIAALVEGLTGAVALHAGAVLWKNACILLPGASGIGKTSLVAWLVDRGCRYLSDELVILPDRNGNVTAFPRSMAFKPNSENILSELPRLAQGHIFKCGAETIVRPSADAMAVGGSWRCGMVIIPQYAQGAKISIIPISPAEAGFRLMASAVNARHLADGGLAAITALARGAAAFVVQYGDFAQLHGTLDTLAEFVLEREGNTESVRRFLAAFGTGSLAKAYSPRRPERPAATPRTQRPTKLTIGMATYDDFDGVYFSLQALRLYHPEVLEQIEFLVVDNHPDGPAAPHLKQLERSVANYRYVPVGERQGTIVKEVVIREAASDYVLCMDCHVLIAPGGVRALMAYFDRHPHSRDLIQGPLLYDDLRTVATHWEPTWSRGMLGVWHNLPLAEMPTEPQEIGFQGMGLFACRKDAWVGFNPGFRGFAVEEWYTHENFRRAGGKVVCLPELLWMHRFQRPRGVPYRVKWDERIRNYLIAWKELSQPTGEMEAHFSELLGADQAKLLFESAREQMREPSLESTR
jgi:hypothetical protein